MDIIKLDLTGCKDIVQLHERIRKAFHFPAWYTQSWEAFWNLLWSDCDADKVVITGERSLPKELRCSLTLMHEALEDTAAFRERCGLVPFSCEVIS